MNFLAHLYLSGNNNDLLIGNFIADYVKGQKKNDYPAGIKAGIELHRAIDDFTDHHLITADSKKRLYPKHHKYAGPIVDIFYDHFLAKNFSDYSSTPLPLFAANAYSIILKNKGVLPERVLMFLPHMIEHNWLVGYASIDGISRTLKGLSRRVAFANRMDEAGDDLVENYSTFEHEFSRFFPELINFAASKR